ncbi:copper amine oxidase N-terminal domain-containing protein [Cohnella ginsengisoli]|uniref:Copper amine oxidase N-terminal domain-containing protein n=1 Tax=Cohnella ginsengisoli TaxID=425004 RepID=A0A9X4KQV8_9BACL|nr:hypothetical protein [Cohnella ginsengisoli]MDG0794025.1 copper amine oxidase N-terminal domain-containing protein [Cohnella ginsengisoli]
MHAGNRFVRSLMLTLITAFLLLPLDAFAAGTQQAPSASSPLRLMLNGKLSKAVPILLDKTPYVPLEPAVFAVLGYKLTQSGSLYRFTSAAVSGEFGSDKAAIINNEPVTLPEAAIPYKGKRYAPLRLLSSLFGLEAVYRPKTGTIELKSTAGRQALLFGYITRQDGTPVKKGMLSMTTWSPALKSNVEVSATVTEGFFRVVLQPNTVYQPFSVFDFGFTNFILHGVDPITLQAGGDAISSHGRTQTELVGPLAVSGRDAGEESHNLR